MEIEIKEEQLPENLTAETADESPEDYPYWNLDTGEILDIVLKELEDEIQIIADDYEPESVYSFCFEHLVIPNKTLERLRTKVNYAYKIEWLLKRKLPTLVSGTREIVPIIQLTRYDPDNNKLDWGFYVHITLVEVHTVRFSLEAFRGVIQRALFLYERYASKYKSFGSLVEDLLHKQTVSTLDSRTRYGYSSIKNLPYYPGYKFLRLMDFEETLDFLAVLVAHHNYLDNITNSWKNWFAARGMFVFPHSLESYVEEVQKTFREHYAPKTAIIQGIEKLKAADLYFQPDLDLFQMFEDKQDAYVKVISNVNGVVRTAKIIKAVKLAVNIKAIAEVEGHCYLISSKDKGAHLDSAKASAVYDSIYLGETHNLVDLDMLLTKGPKKGK